MVLFENMLATPENRGKTPAPENTLTAPHYIVGNLKLKKLGFRKLFGLAPYTGKLKEKFKQCNIRFS